MSVSHLLSLSAIPRTLQIIKEVAYWAFVIIFSSKCSVALNSFCQATVEQGTENTSAVLWQPLEEKVSSGGNRWVSV